MQGEGLGKGGTGMVDPIEVKVLPSNTSLDFIHDKKRRKQGKGGDGEGGEDSDDDGMWLMMGLLRY